jgi:hypothetical protein
MDEIQEFITALEERFSSGRGTTERFAESNLKECISFVCM